MNQKKLGTGLALATLMALGSASRITWGQEAATKPAPTAQESELRAMIRDLGDANATVCEAAQAKLAALPRSAMRPVWAVEEQMMADGTIKVRAVDRLGQWEENCALSPNLVTLDVKDQSIDEVVAEISRQTGVDMVVWPDRQYRTRGFTQDKRITLHADKQAFWLVLRDLAAQVSLRVDNRGNNTVYLTLDEAENGLACLAGEGPFYILGTYIERNYRTNLMQIAAKDRTNRSFQLQAFGVADPGLHVVNGTWKVEATEITDNKGHSMLPQKAPTPQNWGTSGWLCNVNMPMKYPQGDAGDKIQVLKGTLSAEVVVRTDHVEFTDLKKAATKELGDMDVTLQEVKVDADHGVSLKLKVEQGGTPNALWRKVTGWNQFAVKVTDAAGAEYWQHGTGIQGSGTAQQFDLQFSKSPSLGEGAKLGPPAKVLVMVPSKTKVLVVPFEFHDLQMP